MTYKRLNFTNRSVERPRTYSVTENQDGSITLRDAFGEIYVEGTPLDAANMNYLEDGIAACGLTKYAASTTYNKNELVLDETTGKVYVSQVDNNKGTALTNLTYWKLLVVETLETPRKINGTNFDGSADITTNSWGSARNISIASSDGTEVGSAVSVNGSTAAILKLHSTIKADIIGDVTGNCSGSSESCNGNSVTATKAEQDAEGNVIVSTYTTKAELEAVNNTIDNLTERVNGIDISIESLEDDISSVFSNIVPDYTQGAWRNRNTQYIADTDGWLYASVNSRGHGTRITLTINGANLDLYAEDYATNTCLYPISKNSSYSWSLSGDDLGSFLYFYPSKGAN